MAKKRKRKSRRNMALVVVLCWALFAFFFAAGLHFYCQTPEDDAPVFVPVLTAPAEAETPVLLQISELVAANSIGMGDRRDWVELYNPSQQAVRLSDYMLEGKALPDVVLGVGQYYVFGDLKLSKDGGVVTLCRRDGVETDRLEYPPMKNDQAYTRASGLTYDQTPGMANTPENAEIYRQKLDDSRTSSVLVSEVMTSNSTVLKSRGDYWDWIELVNRGSEPVHLLGWSLCDKESGRDALVLPDVVLGPGEYYTVFASGDASLTKNGDIHGDFALSKSGEHVYLFDPAGQFADGVYVPGDLPAECSYGRMDGRAGFVYFDVPTPRAKNGVGVSRVMPAPETELCAGMYDADEIFVPLTGAGEIRYTLDGSEPTADSALYTEPLCLRKTSVIRAAAFGRDALPSEPVTFNYYLREDHSLPVVSLSCAPEELFDPVDGLYMFGSGAATEFPYDGANFYSEREVSASFTYTENGKQVAMGNCGLKLFGQSGRAYEKKSFTVKFRGRYGDSSLAGPFFGEVEEFRTLVLRSGSQDSRRAMIRDEFFTALGGELSLPVQRYRACVLYLNDEYWGVYYIREKLNADFCADYLGVEPETVDMLQWNSKVLAGSSSDYLDLIDFVTRKDLTKDENYRYVEERVDLDNVIDYHLAQAYAGNKDNGNIKFFRSTAGDGKWRWIYFDLDFGFREDIAPIGYQIDPLGTGYQHKFNNIMIRKLLENAEFLEKFKARAREVYATVYDGDKVMNQLNAMVAEIEPEMKRDRDRWQMRMSSWRWEVSVMRDFITKDGGRTKVILDEIETLFGE